MRRSFFAALGIAAISALATALLYESGVPSRFARNLADHYANLGLIDRDTAPHRGFHYLAFTLLSMATAWAFLNIPRPAHRWIGIVGTMVLVITLPVTLLLFGLFFEPFSALLAILTAASLSLAYSLTRNGSRNAILRLCLSGRASRKTLANLLATDVSGLIEGQHRKLTVLCLRLFNLGALRAALPPPELVELTSLFLRHSAEFLVRHGACLDDSSPDSVHASFGLTGDDSHHANHACKTARELNERLTNLNSEFEARFLHRLQYGIALASGDATLGLCRLGRVSRLHVIGDLAEYAHHLCDANAAYGSHILLDAETFALIRESFAVRPMELIYDLSKELMAEAYELLDLKDRLDGTEESARQRFWQGVILYREGRAEEALRIFSELQADRPTDRPLHYFIGRVQSLLPGEPEPFGHPAVLLHGHARILQGV